MIPKQDEYEDEDSEQDEDEDSDQEDEGPQELDPDDNDKEEEDMASDPEAASILGGNGLPLICFICFYAMILRCTTVRENIGKFRSMLIGIQSIAMFYAKPKALMVASPCKTTRCSFSVISCLKFMIL